MGPQKADETAEGNFPRHWNPFCKIDDRDDHHYLIVVDTAAVGAAAVGAAAVGVAVAVVGQNFA